MTKKEVEQIVYRTIINAFKKFYQKSMTNKNKIRPRSYPFITTKGTDDYDEDTLEEFVIPEIPTNKNKNEEVTRKVFDTLAELLNDYDVKDFVIGQSAWDIIDLIKQQRASAVREFAERLKVNFGKELHCTPYLDLTIPFNKAVELSQIEEEV